MSSDKRRRRKEIDLLSRESTWLQKALFALQKAEGARERLADLQNEDPPPFILEFEGSELSVDDFQQALENRIKNLLEDIREQRRILR